MIYHDLRSPLDGEEIVSIRQYIGSTKQIFDDIKHGRGASYIVKFKNGTETIAYRNEIEATFEEANDYYKKYFMMICSGNGKQMDCIERCNAAENLFCIEEVQGICYCCKHYEECEMVDSHNTTEGTFCTKCGYYDPIEEE